jgi:outer membrane protein assembly factor BamB
MVSSIFAAFTQNLGPISMNASGAGGLADSPWPMFRGNLNHTGLSPYNTSGNNGQLKWSFETDGNVFSSPAIDSDGIIYFGSYDYNVYAINPDGTEKWSFTTGEKVRSSPAIGSDGTIYIGSVDKKLYAINPDGTEKWNFTTSEHIYSSPIMVSDGTIYISSNDGYLYAINPDGTEKWNFTTGSNVESSPAIGSDGTIYVGCWSNKVYAINPDGTEKWNFTTGSHIVSSPAISDDSTIYIGSYDRKLYAINPDGSEKWNFTTGDEVKSSPAIGSDGTIYIGSYDRKLYAINPDGSEKWNFTTGDAIFSSPAIDSAGMIYIGSLDNKLYAINPDGTEKWSFITGDLIFSSPTIDAEGTIYIGSWDNKLYAIGTPNLKVNVTSHFSILNSAAQSLITVQVTNDTNPIQGAIINLTTDNGGFFSPQSGITDVNGNFTSIFNAPTVTTQTICRISAQASKTGYGTGSGYVDVTIKPIPWPMFRHNLNHTGVSPYDTSTNPGKLKWSFSTGAVVYSSPAIGSDGTIYIGSGDNKFYAINPDGTLKWNFPMDGGVISCPAIGSDGTIYFGISDTPDPYGLLYALNPDGTEKWNFSTNGDIHSSPAIGSDGTIYVGSADYKLYAINPDGTEKWNFTAGDGIASSPAIGSDGTIYVGSQDSKLYAINPDGTEKWRFNTLGTCHSSPSIGSDGTIYIGSTDSRLYAINPDGTEKWSYNTGGMIQFSSPAIGTDGIIYIGSLDKNLHAINPNGTRKWTFTTGSGVDSSPAISSDGTIYIGSWDNNLYAINPDGTEKWNFTTGWAVRSAPAIGSDGTIYVGSQDYKLYAIGPNIPPIADAGSDQIVNVGDVVEFNGSASYDPDGTIVLYEWDFNASDGLWWETGAPPDAFGPDPIFTYYEYGIYNVTLRVTDNNGSMDTDTCELTVLVLPPKPPILYINVNLDKNDVILYWDPPPTPGIKYYLIYRSTSQIDFDFDTIWVNTSKDNESGEPLPIPLRTMWNDTNAAFPGNETNYEEQYYYAIRAMNSLGEVSRTSRTVGKWTKSFPGGVSTFSLPLEPLEIMNTTIDYYLKDMNARYIKWMDPVNHIWMKHGDGGNNDTQIEVGKGYEVAFDLPSNYTFTGMPGAMIRYDDDTGFLGFDPASESKNLTAIVDPMTGNVTLNWTKPFSMDIKDQYLILRSTERDGFWNGNYLQLVNLSFDTLSYTDIGNATAGTRYYYMIAPVNETGVEGASTYSIGVLTANYSEQYDTMGIPLKIANNEKADYYCDQIDNVVGINYFRYLKQRWGWHSTRMPAGAYDPDMVMTEGYQISTIVSTKYSFIGI